MKRTSPSIPALLLFLAGTATSLAACGSDTPREVAGEIKQAREEIRVMGVELTKLEREIREDLATSNIDFGGINFGDHADHGDSDAEITPDGDLLIKGEKIAIDDDEREMLLAYREQVSGLALTGAKIGMQGADIATSAMGQAFKGMFSGNSDDMEANIEKEVEAQVAKLQAEVEVLCGQLVPLKQSQDALAGSIPELAPYANLTQAEIDECHSEAESDNFDFASDHSGT